MNPRKDTFSTLRYRDGYIHGCYNRQTGREEFHIQHPRFVRSARSLHAAKCLLTRLSRVS